MTEPTPEPTTIDEVILAIQGMNIILPKTATGAVRAGKVDRYADLEAVNERVLSVLNSLSTTWVCVPTFAGGEFVLACTLKHVPSGTSIEATWPIGKQAPQAMGSGVTYGRRYALLAVTGIAAKDDDDDGNVQQPASRVRSDRAGGATAQRSSPPTRGERSRPSEQPAPPTPPASPPSPPAPGPDVKQRRMFAQFRDLGLGEKEDREARLGLVTKMLGRQIGSVSDLSAGEVDGVIDALGKALRQEGPKADLQEAAVEIYRRTSGEAQPPVAEPPAREQKPSRGSSKPKPTTSAREALGGDREPTGELAPWDGEIPGA